MAVVRRGGIAYEAGFGFADVAAREPVTAATRFAIGSLTKQLTAALIEPLAGEGKLSLDHPLSKYDFHGGIGDPTGTSDGPNSVY